MKNIRELIEQKLENAKLDLANGHYSNKAVLLGNIEAYQDLLALIRKPRREQEILKDFEDLGYDIENHNEMFYLKKGKYYIAINKTDKTYKAFYQYVKFDEDHEKIVCYRPKGLTLREHKLLNELFILWGWI